MKEIKGGFDGPRAVTWEEGRTVAGFFVSADSIDGVESRKLNFDTNGSGEIISCWETSALKSIVKQMDPGYYYVITCNGKKKFKNGHGWTFTVVQPESGSETEECIKKYSGVIKALRDALNHDRRPQDTNPDF